MIMGFYVRKSLKAGPFRFNLSSSGIGVSAGVPGFRVGTGPRGNYVHMGANGVYYRASGSGGVAGPRSAPGPAVRYGNQIQLEDITGASVEELVPSAGGDLVNQLNAAESRIRLGWPVFWAVLALGLITMPFGLIIWSLGVPLIWWLFLRDAARKSVVVFYDVNDTDAAEYAAMVDAAVALSHAKGLWRVVSSGQVQAGYQQKTNAGAGQLVGRVVSTVSHIGPKALVTNVAVPTINAGKSSLHFLPDRVLLHENKRYTDFAYPAFSVTSRETRFIENAAGYPADGHKVGETWQYVNVKGGPDRRFANNPVLPIFRYAEISMHTASGFRWELQTSLLGPASEMTRAVSSRSH